MDVYISKCLDRYGGGMAIVAANSEEEALKTAFESGSYEFRGFDESWNEIPSYSCMSKFEKIEGMSFDCNTPQVIAIDIYCE